MTTFNFATSSNTIKFTFGTVTETHTHQGETYTNTYHSFDNTAGRGDFEVTHIIIVDADNDTQTNDVLINAAIAA